MGQIVSDVTDILGNKKADAQANSERKKILSQMANDEKAKTNLIKKVLASQRAKYGSSGMSGDGMTEEAVLKRMRDETAEPYDTKKKNNLEKLKSVKANKKNLVGSLLSDFGKIFE